MMRVVALLAAVASASAFSVAPVRDRHCYLLNHVWGSSWRTQPSGLGRSELVAWEGGQPVCQVLAGAPQGRALL